MEYNMLKELFFGIFQFANKIEKRTLIYLSEDKFVGNEYMYCTYDENDDDYMDKYKEGFVTLFFYEPFVKEDTIVYCKNDVFYKELIDFLHKMDDSVDDMKELEVYLAKIKTDLKIDLD